MISTISFAVLLSMAGAQDLFQASKGDAPGIPTLPMKNAAGPNMKFPLMGLGAEGHGWKIGQKMECWYWPQCCTKDHCPIINSVSDYIQTAVAQGGVARIDTGYPFGDNAKSSESHICEGGAPGDDVVKFVNTTSAQFLARRLHPGCDTHGIGLGIKKSGAKREDIFVSVKVGFAGPMGGTNLQVKSLLKHLALDYADLCMVHYPEIGPGTGSHGEYGPYNCVPGHGGKGDPYDASKCRINTYKNMLENMKAGQCKSVGVFGWDASQIDEIAKAGLELPSVVQYKFHAHQSAASQVQKDLLDYTAKHGIIFNGIAPLGAPDWVTFTDSGMKATSLEEPLVQEIAKNVGKTPAQVLLRWIIQQNVATQARTMSVSHMKENLDVFDWTLSSDDMQKLSSMPQCKTIRGNPYADGDPAGGNKHGNVIGLTEHC